MTQPNASAAIALLVPQDHQEEIRTHYTSAQGTLEALEAWPCETVKDEQDLGEMLGAVKGQFNAWEEKRTSITKPLLEAKRAVDSLFKPMLDTLARAERIIKDKLAAAHVRRMEANAAAQAQAGQLAQAGNPQAASQELAKVQVVQAPPGVQFQEGWDFTVEDLDAVPRAWLSVDHSKVRIYLRDYSKSQTVPPVPGLRFFRSPIVKSKSG